MRSYDFYDTLFCRLVARPTDIFRLVERELSLPGFAHARIRAERVARRAAAPREVTLDEIYQHLILPARSLREARALEERLEGSLLVPVRSMVERIRAEDLVVSDTYMAAGALEGVLSSHVGIPSPRVVVSSVVGHRKADGSLWAYLARAHPDLVEHVGPARHPIDALPGCQTRSSRARTRAEQP